MTGDVCFCPTITIQFHFTVTVSVTFGACGRSFSLPTIAVAMNAEYQIDIVTLHHSRVVYPL